MQAPKPQIRNQVIPLVDEREAGARPAGESLAREGTGGTSELTDELGYNELMIEVL